MKRRLVTKSGIRYSFENTHGTVNQLHLRLIVQVGSLNESDSVRGAAHFIEHLGFRGTRKFDHGELVSFVEGLGSNFGPDLNAKTSLCETIWQLDISPTALRSGLEILNEWAFWIRISNQDVESERKVILEEWRQKQNPSHRAKTKFWESIACFVAKRAPIGTIDFIEQANIKELRDFYESTYVHEKMSIICVVEQSSTTESSVSYEDFVRVLEETFTPENCPVRRQKCSIVRDNPKDLFELREADLEFVKFACVIDPDLMSSSISLEFLSDEIQPNTGPGFFRRDIIKRILSSILDERFRMRRLSSDSPHNTSVSFGVAVNTPYVEMSCVRTDLKFRSSPHEVESSLVNLIQELLLCYQVGFSQNELDRAKAKWRRFVHDQIRTASMAVSEWVRKFRSLISISQTNLQAKYNCRSNIFH